MKKIIILIYVLMCSIYTFAIVDFMGKPYAIPYDEGPSCLGNQYFQVGFHTNFELNNDKFVIERSLDPNFSWATTGTSGFNGNINGCGTCGQRSYSTLDYGPFQPGEVWYYRVKAISKNANFSYSKKIAVYIGMPTVVNWVNQVTHQVMIGSSPSTASSYLWKKENRNMQGVAISLMPTEISHIYLERGNNRISFNSQSITPFYNLEVNVNNGGYSSIYTGSSGGTTNFIWSNSSAYFNQLGDHTLKVRFMSATGTLFYREYRVHVVPKSDELHVDNYCNTLRVWKSGASGGGVPIVFSEGFDAYNTRSEQFYRYAGNELINCLLDKGFDIYVINYTLNTQSIKNNAAIFQSAIWYVSGVNNNRKVVPIGMSMGGVINRYACAKAEHDGNPLPISKFVSLDAPHQGAVISETFQDYRKKLVDESPDTDPYAEHNLNNDAAKEMLWYNAWDSEGVIHNDFYNYLNNLNGDGYPHLVETIGVSFSNKLRNPNTGNWLTIKIPGQKNKHFELSNPEKLPGSYLPGLDIDPFPLVTPKFWLSWLLSFFRPYSDPMVVIDQLSSPTFIPHDSSLDIVNGQSKFDIAIIPQHTHFHDVVPSDIIKPLVNAILEDNIYVQNVTYNNNRTIVSRKKMYVGKEVDINEPIGEVYINSTANVVFKAGEEVNIMSGINVELGANLIVEINDVKCDGVKEYQQKSLIVEENLPNVEEIYDVIEQNNSLQIIYNDPPNINIFPNPFTDEITIQYVSFSDNMGELIIFDETGRVVHQSLLENKETERSNDLTINLAGMKSGVYTCVIKFDEITLNRKLIKL